MKRKTILLKSTATGGDFFKLLMGNLLILIFTLGFGYAWIETRTMEFMTNKINMQGDIDLDSLQQTEEDYKDATSEGFADFFEIDLLI